MSDPKTLKRSVQITGIGLLSSLGEGVDDHWQALNSGKPRNVDATTYPPYTVHTLETPDWTSQISRRDMRQMEPWQRIGTYAAGLALDDAGVKGNEEVCGWMDIIVSAGGGERDTEVDASILEAGRDADNRDAVLAEKLSNELRPTLFLAQLSNLLAGSISIAHKVTGSSRTFMGEESAGISAIQTATARIASAQSEIILVGGAFNSEREDMLLSFELAHQLARGDAGTVWSRAGKSVEDAGIALGSIGAFLVLESEDHMKARGGNAYGTIAAVEVDHGRREREATRARLAEMLERLGTHGASAILSGASGSSPITSEELDFFRESLPESALRAYGTMLGHGVEAQFPIGIALAAIALDKQDFYRPFEDAETALADAPSSIIVTTLGHWCGEGLARVERNGD